MARKPKIKPIMKLWELETKDIQKVIDKLKDNFPNSKMLVKYEKEIGRRNDDLSVEDFYKVESE